MAYNSNSVEFNTYIPNILDNVPAEIEDRLLDASMAIHKEVVRSIGGNREGRRYKVPATSRYYRASKPFEPPATMLGGLVQSYQFKVSGRGWNSVGYVGSNLKYAYWLEFGTRKMAMRPHLRKGAHKVLKKMPNFFEELYK